MMTDDHRTVTAEEIQQLIPTALRRPAPEGARLVALWYLHQLLAARAQWRRPLDGDAGATPDREATLHEARVALRRLRATLREHDRVLDGVADRRLLRHLRTLGRATSAQRDRDVQGAWLDAEAEHLAPEVRTEAHALRARLARRIDGEDDGVERAFTRHLDPIAPMLLSRLSRYSLVHRVGHEQAPAAFARQLADRLTRAAARLRRDLGHIGDVPDQPLLHELRIRLKRQRALLAPFVRTRPALGAWFTQATRGQDQLGALRDAHLLAERARKAKHHALARVLDDSMLGHFAAFHEDWVTQREARIACIERAAASLRVEGAPQSAEGLPMEIERKYLLRGCPPEAAAVAPSRIEQGWIPGAALRERLRRKTGPDGAVTCWRTMKLGAAEARLEIEESMPLELFEAMWPLTRSARVRKERHVVVDGAHTWEIDVFLDRPLVVAEVELGDVQEAVTLPPWLVSWVERDVTGDPAYFNATLARPEP